MLKNYKIRDSFEREFFITSQRFRASGVIELLQDEYIGKASSDEEFYRENNEIESGNEVMEDEINLNSCEDSSFE